MLKVFKVSDQFVHNDNRKLLWEKLDDNENNHIKQNDIDKITVMNSSAIFCGNLYNHNGKNLLSKVTHLTSCRHVAYCVDVQGHVYRVINNMHVQYAAHFDEKILGLSTMETDREIYAIVITESLGIYQIDKWTSKFVMTCSIENWKKRIVQVNGQIVSFLNCCSLLDDTFIDQQQCLHHNGKVIENVDYFVYTDAGILYLSGLLP